MDPADARKNYPAISAAADDMVVLLTPRFTNTTGFHVETGISAAASLAGLSMLRNKGFDLGEFRQGTIILSELDTEMDEIWNFMMAAAQSMGLDPSGGWEREIPEAHKPLYGIPEMTQRTEKDFLDLCNRHHLKKDFFPYVAVLAALKLVYAANTMKILEQNIGKALTGYYIVAGAKTVPFPLEE
jgi:hypothetical protein